MKRGNLASLLSTMLALTACHTKPEPPQIHAQEPLHLRGFYRDASSTMVLALPEADKPKPQGDCIAPLLIDTLTGAVRVLTDAEVQARLRTMQLAGAKRSACHRIP